MTQRIIGGRKATITTGAAAQLFTTAELQTCSEMNPLEVIIRNTHATNRIDFGAADVASGTGYGLLALATLSFRIRSVQGIPWVIATTSSIDVEMAWSGPFCGT